MEVATLTGEWKQPVLTLVGKRRKRRAEIRKQRADMKRIGNIFDEMVSCENLADAHREAKRGKKKRKHEILAFEKDFDANIRALHESLISGTWRMHEYKRIERSEAGKRRVIYYDPCYADTIVQHAIGRTLGNRLIHTFIPDTYAGMKNRGIHHGVRRIRRHLDGYLDLQPIYIFKFDLRHYYESIDHDVLKSAIRAKIKDRRAIDLCFHIIDSHSPGLPIGNYISPLFANFLLSPYDHWAKESFRVRGYFRYLDDVVAIDPDKNRLKEFAVETADYMAKHALTIKPNRQIFPIERYGIDFMGYVFRRHDIRLRKRVERKFRRTSIRFLADPSEHNRHRLGSYWGWLKWLTHGGKLWFSIFDKPLTELEVKNV